jgi:hypothetical protein
MTSTVRSEWDADEATFRLPTLPLTPEGEAANARLVAEEDLERARRVLAMRRHQLARAKRGGGLFDTATETATVRALLFRAAGRLGAAVRAARRLGLATA